MPTRLDVLLQRRKSAAAELLHRHTAANASAGSKPAVMRGANRLGGWGFSGVIQVKLYQLIDDFAWTTRRCQRGWRCFQAEGYPNLTRPALFAPGYGKNRDSYPCRTGIVGKIAGSWSWTTIPERNLKLRFFGASSRICAPARTFRTSI